MLVECPARRIVGQQVECDRRATTAGADEHDVPQVAALADGVERLRQQLVRILSDANDGVRRRWPWRRKLSLVLSPGKLVGPARQPQGTENAPVWNNLVHW